MSESTVDSQAGALADRIHAIDIAVPVETVWEEITKTGRIQKALYNTVLECELVPGSRLRYYSPNRKRVFIVGEVLEVEPPHLFRHTFVMTPDPEAPTVVTWRLEAISTGTRVTITHSGWTDEHKAPEKTASGWDEILGLLKADLETGKLPLKTRFLYGVMGLFLFMAPKGTKLEEVEKRGW